MNRPRTLPPVLVTTVVTLLLALYWWLGLSATRDNSSTFDEMAYVTGGFSYGKFHDHRLQPENGSLPQRLAALPWVAGDAHMDTSDPKAWGNSNVWIIGHQFFYHSGNNTDYLLFLSRATMALLGVALGGLIFAWSRRLWGDAGGLVSLGLYVFCPNFLANAPLATSDVAMSLALLAACGAYWRQTRRLDWKTGLLSVVVVALTCVTKFSFVLLLPIFALMIAIRLWSDEPLTVDLGTPRDVTTWRGKLSVLALSACVHVAAAWIMIWACFGFRFAAAAPGLPGQIQFFAPWSIIMPGHGFWHGFFEVMRHWHLLPDAFLAGFAYVLYAAAERGAFLNGEYSSTGWAYFFPYAFLVKTTWPELIAFALTGGLTLTAWRHAGPVRAAWTRVWTDLYRVAPLLILFVVYWAFSITSHLNIGLRHILPTYPVLFIGAGLLARPAAQRWLAAVAVGLVLWTAVESARVRPHYLAYFNSLAGGPEGGWRHLVDSSLDWGQDLPGLAAWLKKESRPGEQVYLSYFGGGDYEYEGIRALELAPITNFYRPLRWFELGPGLYCLSATLLQDVYSGWRGAWTLEKERNYVALRALLAKNPPSSTPEEQRRLFELRYTTDQMRFSRLSQYLWLRRPEAVIGHTIFVYRLSAEEIHAAAYGSMKELAAVMEQALPAKP
jgi:Dolichyl-phosphate-mannose-protein mannosyltransferase